MPLYPRSAFYVIVRHIRAARSSGGLGLAEKRKHTHTQNHSQGEIINTVANSSMAATLACLEGHRALRSTHNHSHNHAPLRSFPFLSFPLLSSSSRVVCLCFCCFALFVSSVAPPWQLCGSCGQATGRERERGFGRVVRVVCIAIPAPQWPSQPWLPI